MELDGIEARIAVVVGSAQADSRLHGVLDVVGQSLLEAQRERPGGVKTQVLNLAEVALPVMEFGSDAQAVLPAIRAVREHASWADAFVLLTPEYHGSMSGALKNWFDFLWRELAGKLAGVISVTGGGSGDMSIQAVKTCFAWCHGFTLPFHAAARPADFDPNGNLVDAVVRDRVQRIAHDVVRYGPPLRRMFEQAKARGVDPRAGFAGRHAEEDDDV